MTEYRDAAGRYRPRTADDLGAEHAQLIAGIVGQHKHDPLSHSEDSSLSSPALARSMVGLPTGERAKLPAITIQ